MIAWIATYIKCFGSASFHAGPPSFLARTRSTSSASWSSMTRSTSWLRSDLFELDEECDVNLLSKGLADLSLSLPFESPLLAELDLCRLSCVSSCMLWIRLFLRFLCMPVGWRTCRFEDAVMIAGSRCRIASLSAVCAVITGYLSSH